MNQGITITGGNGEFVVETTNGHVSLTNMESASVDAASINGNIKYDGTVAPSGKFRFSTHNGSIVVAVPETTSAAFTVRTYNGSLNTNLPLKTAGEVRRGQRATYTLGSGSADFELESFGGTIQLRKRGSDQPLQRLKDKDLDDRRQGSSVRLLHDSGSAAWRIPRRGSCAGPRECVPRLGRAPRPESSRGGENWVSARAVPGTTGSASASPGSPTAAFPPLFCSVIGKQTLANHVRRLQ